MVVDYKKKVAYEDVMAYGRMTGFELGLKRL